VRIHLGGFPPRLVPGPALEETAQDGVKPRAIDRVDRAVAAARQDPHTHQIVAPRGGRELLGLLDGDDGVVRRMQHEHGNLRVGDVLACGGAVPQLSRFDLVVRGRDPLDRIDEILDVLPTRLPDPGRQHRPEAAIDEVSRVRAREFRGEPLGHRVGVARR
jgi:hypothetical protein